MAAAAAAREADTVVSGGDMSWSSLGSSLMCCNRDGGSAVDRFCSSCIASAVVLRAAASIWAADGGGISGTTNGDLVGFGGADGWAGG